MTEEEIKAFLFDSNALSNPEYTALKNRNDEIEVIFLAIDKPAESKEIPALYAEFVENNNKMAQLMGYDNYLEYAYENVYSRDYSYQDADQIRDFVKQYLVELFVALAKGGSNAEYTNAEYKDFTTISTLSFFENQKVNQLVNGYIDTMAFTSNPDKQISFSDTLNNLILDDNLFKGQYKGAFVTYFSAFDLPIAYFGPGYYGASTIVHEFGHYMNEIYNNSEYDQSFDLLETHSQGNEIIYLNYLKTQLSKGTYALLEASQIKDMLQTVIISLSVDEFEQAVYLNTYDGVGADAIMADGNITADEYDTLFNCVLQSFGVSGMINSAYWRYVTIGSPCYYVSYAVSALSILQLHEIAYTESLETATDAYLKLFTYTDVNPDMNTEEVLLYSGMHSYTDEALYKEFAEYMALITK
jgi:hypothetical protein